MKKLYTLFSCLLFSCFHLAAQTQSQYFDGADTSFFSSINIELDPDSTNIWQIGQPQKPIFNVAATFPNAIVTDTINYYPPNNTSRFTAKIIVQSIFVGVYAIQWKQKLDFDSMSDDGGILEFTIDNGVTWQNAFNNPYVYNFYGFQPSNVDTLANGEMCFSGTDTVWRDIWLCFEMSWMSQFPDTIMTRFSSISDSMQTLPHEGWMIDNMMSHFTIVHTVNEVNNGNYLNVFPNPTDGIVHVQVKKQTTFHIIEHMELVDAQGRIVAQWENIPTKFWFDAAKYGEGVYVLNVRTNLQSESVPIIVTKQR